MMSTTISLSKGFPRANESYPPGFNENWYTKAWFEPTLEDDDPRLFAWRHDDMPLGEYYVFQDDSWITQNVFYNDDRFPPNHENLVSDCGFDPRHDDPRFYVWRQRNWDDTRIFWMYIGDNETNGGWELVLEEIDEVDMDDDDDEQPEPPEWYKRYIASLQTVP